MTSRH